MRQLHLVGYDISGNATRRRVLSAIKGNAIGGQKSAYECWLDSRELSGVREEIGNQIDDACDRVIIVRLDPRAVVHTLGVAIPPADGALFYQG